MRAHVNLSDGTVSTEWPLKPADYRQSVKALTGERVEVRFYTAGTAVLLPEGTAMALVVVDSKGGTTLAEVTSFTAPEDVTTGYYTARLSFDTENVLDLLADNPTKESFLVTGALSWKIPDQDEWEESDDMAFTLLRKVGASGGDPLVLTSPFVWLQGVLVGGDNITLTVNEGAGTITVAAATAGNFTIDRVSDDQAFLVVKNAAGADVCLIPRYDLPA